MGSEHPRGRSPFDRTYEGLKLGKAANARGVGGAAFDRTYEGLKRSSRMSP